MNNSFFRAGALLAALSVVFGAFGAHFLKPVLDEQALEIFETGVRYQFYHSIALFIVAIASERIHLRLSKIAGWLFIAGIVFFSGSLYLLALSDVLNLGSFRPVLGPMTPIGGLMLIAGWLALFRAGFSKE